MFVLDKEANKITKVESKTFHDFGFKEREHLQEWIANYPECLGEELLIILFLRIGDAEFNKGKNTVVILLLGVVCISRWRNG